MQATRTIRLCAALFILLLCGGYYWVAHERQFVDKSDVKTDTSLIQKDLEKLLTKLASSKDIHQISLSIAIGSIPDPVHISVGPAIDSRMSEHTPYFLTSISKLFACAIIMQLQEEEKLSLRDPIIQYFPEGMLNGLHVFNGQEFTDQISIAHLLAHSSGLGDYFADQRIDGSRLSTTLLSSKDANLTLAQIIRIVRLELKPQFPPGKGVKAHYSDTNYQLLGHIIESASGLSLAQNIQSRISEPLGLGNTYLFQTPTEQAHDTVLPLRVGEALLRIPQAMQSARLDGGMISTSAETLLFLRAFMEGKLFSRQQLQTMQDWQPLSNRLKAGMGLLKYQTPWHSFPIGKRHTLIGYAGMSGAFAYYSPSANVYLSGTINQIANQTLPYELMLEVLRLLD